MIKVIHSNPMLRFFLLLVSLCVDWFSVSSFWFVIWKRVAQWISISSDVWHVLWIANQMFYKFKTNLFCVTPRIISCKNLSQNKFTQISKNWRRILQFEWMRIEMEHISQTHKRKRPFRIDFKIDFNITFSTHNMVSNDQ